MNLNFTIAYPKQTFYTIDKSVMNNQPLPQLSPNRELNTNQAIHQFYKSIQNTNTNQYNMISRVQNGGKCLACNK